MKAHNRFVSLIAASAARRTNPNEIERETWLDKSTGRASMERSSRPCKAGSARFNRKWSSKGKKKKGGGIKENVTSSERSQTKEAATATVTKKTTRIWPRVGSSSSRSRSRTSRDLVNGENVGHRNFVYTGTWKHQRSWVWTVACSTRRIPIDWRLINGG